MAGCENEGSRIVKSERKGKLMTEVEAWRLIEEGKLPSTLDELQVVLEYCESIEKWNPTQTKKGVRFMIKEIRNQVKNMIGENGKLIWGPTRIYEMLQWMVMQYSVKQDSIALKTQQKNATLSISG